jgi:hypothetical protein
MNCLLTNLQFMPEEVWRELDGNEKAWEEHLERLDALSARNVTALDDSDSSEDSETDGDLD